MKHDLQVFNQIVLLHLKQTQDPDQKRLIRSAVQIANGDQPSLVMQDGDIDLSIISAIGSHKQ